jgi:hypothetical protein
MRTSLAVLLLVQASACRSLPPPLDTEPWADLAPGQVSISVKPDLFTLYGIEAELTAETPAKGTLTSEDSGDLAGRFGLGVRAEVALRADLVAFAGAEWRVYDIEDLDLIEELDVSIKTVESLQYAAGVRKLFAPLAAAPRWRPWAELSLAYLPTVDVGFEVDLSEFGSSNLKIDTEGEGLWVGGAAGGLVYRLSEHLTGELGALYEVPLNDMQTDLSFSIGSSEVPMDADLRPQGLIGFCALAWRF